MEVFYGQLDRFGTFIECIDTDKDKVEKIIMDKYEEVYKAWNNGEDPRESFEHFDDKSDYDFAKDCIELRSFELGVVQM